MTALQDASAIKGFGRRVPVKPFTPLYPGAAKPLIEGLRRSLTTFGRGRWEGPTPRRKLEQLKAFDSGRLILSPLRSEKQD